MKNFRKACRGQKGFTLIELLVVIIILGVLAAVVTLAVTRFIGKGTLESANAELVTVQAAIESTLADGNASTLDAACTWDGSLGAAAVCPSVTSGNVTVTAYEMMRTHKLKAVYTIDIDGNVTNGDASDSHPDTTPWGATKIEWNGTSDEWAKYTP